MAPASGAAKPVPVVTPTTARETQPRTHRPLRARRSPRARTVCADAAERTYSFRRRKAARGTAAPARGPRSGFLRRDAVSSARCIRLAPAVRPAREPRTRRAVVRNDGVVSFGSPRSVCAEFFVSIRTLGNPSSSSRSVYLRTSRATTRSPGTRALSGRSLGMIPNIIPITGRPSSSMTPAPVMFWRLWISNPVPAIPTDWQCTTVR
jgi:hypothetical protein